MPAARLWRITGASSVGGAALSLSALHLYGAAGRLDAAATLTCSHTPASGALTALQDGDGATVCAFSAAQFGSAGFYLQWDFGAGVTADVWGLRVGGGSARADFLSTCALQYFDGSVWVSAECGAYRWPGVGTLTDAPLASALFATEIGTAKELTAAGSRVWQAVATSGDGQRIVAVVFGGGYLYTSADAGATWVERTVAGSRSWQAVATSSDGQRIAAVVSGGYLYTSADAGATWVERTAAGSRSWQAVPMSADGQRIVAAAYSSYMYVITQRSPQFLEPPSRTRQAAALPLFTRYTAPQRLIAAEMQRLARDTDVGGPGTIYGTTKAKGTPNAPTKARVVLLRQRGKLPVRETWSDPVTGYFEFKGIDIGQQFLTLAEDVDGTYRPVAANRLTPEVLA